MVNFQIRAEVKKVTSRAELKNLQLKLWLEPARLGLITSSLIFAVVDSVGSTKVKNEVTNCCEVVINHCKYFDCIQTSNALISYSFILDSNYSILLLFNISIKHFTNKGNSNFKTRQIVEKVKWRGNIQD